MQIGQPAAALAVAILTACTVPTYESRPQPTMQTGGEPTGIESVVKAADLAAKAVVASGAKRIGILEIRGLDGKRTMLGRFLAEEITTAVQNARTAAVVERRLIDEMMSEGKFSGSGLIDDATAAELGGKLGADAVLAGTLTEFGDDLRFNMRVITTKTGQVAAAKQATLHLDAPLRKLWEQQLATKIQPSGMPTSQRQGASKIQKASPGRFGKVFFEEDFKNVQEGGAPPDWIGTDHFAVKSLEHGKRRFAAFDPGPSHFTIPNVAFPESFRLEWTMSHDCECTSPQAVLRIGDLTAGLEYDYCANNGIHYKAFINKSKADVVPPCNSPFRVTLEKRGNILQLLLDGQQVVLARFSNFKGADSIVLNFGDFVNTQSGIALYSITGTDLGN